MKGRITVFIIVIFTIIFVIFTWLFLQYIIEEFDVDRAIGSTDFFVHYVTDQSLIDRYNQIIS